MVVAISLGILVSVVSVVAMAVLLIAPAALLAKFLRGIQPPQSVVVPAVARERSRPGALAQPHPRT